VRNIQKMIVITDVKPATVQRPIVDHIVNKKHSCRSETRSLWLYLSEVNVIKYIDIFL
jgi:hypothetical protein